MYKNIDNNNNNKFVMQLFYLYISQSTHELNGFEQNTALYTN
jgi:hypothetical protein